MSSLSTLQTTVTPAASEVALRLAARQAAQTCGWVNANPGTRTYAQQMVEGLTIIAADPAVCSAGSTCAVNTVYNVHFCCPVFPCTIPTACLNAAQAATACDSDYQQSSRFEMVRIMHFSQHEVLNVSTDDG